MAYWPDIEAKSRRYEAAYQKHMVAYWERVSKTLPVIQELLADLHKRVKESYKDNTYSYKEIDYHGVDTKPPIHIQKVYEKLEEAEFWLSKCFEDYGKSEEEIYNEHCKPYYDKIAESEAKMKQAFEEVWSKIEQKPKSQKPRKPNKKPKKYGE